MSPAAGAPDRERALALDAADPLRRWRDEFVIDDPALVYLDGNSLGRLPRRTLERLRRVAAEEWGGGLIRSWERWMDLPQRVGDRLAPLLGARPGEVIVHDSTSVNLYQLVHAALGLRPGGGDLAVAPGDFPTDRYVVDGIAAATGRAVRRDLDRLDGVAVVVRSLVDYRSAELADLAGETARAHAAGARTVWDLSHAAGVLPLELGAAGVELAVGCTYKFLNGGPGAPAFSYVAAPLQEAIAQPIHGWFGHREPFAMGPAWAPGRGLARLLVGTPAILALAAAEEGIALTAEAGIAAIAAKAEALGDLAIALADAHGLAVRTPRDRQRRGAHVAVAHRAARALVAELAGRGVIADFRAPDLVRLGLSPLTTRFVDVFDGVTALADLVASSAVGARA